jgi:hypothetical protein
MKLVITVLATFGLLEHTKPINLLAGVAMKTGVLGMDLFGARREMVIASAAALVVLLVVTVLSVYKPRGLTPYGQRKQDGQRYDSDEETDLDALPARTRGIMQARTGSESPEVPVVPFQ